MKQLGACCIAGQRLVPKTHIRSDRRRGGNA
jgi:hypothetical protein